MVGWSGRKYSSSQGFPRAGGVGPSPWFVWECHRYHTTCSLLGNESTALSKAENSRGAKDHRPWSHSFWPHPRKKKKKWSLLNPSLASFLPRMSHSSMSPLLKYPFFPKLFPNFKKRRLSLLLLLCRIMQRPQYTFI